MDETAKLQNNNPVDSSLVEMFIEADGILRIIVTKDGEPEHFIVKEGSDKPYSGDIYRGIIKNVNYQDKSVYIDIGTGKNAYMFISKKDGLNTYKIGDRITVEVLREEAGKKGAKVTDRISLTDSYLVAEEGRGIFFSKNLKKSLFSEKFKELKIEFKNKLTIRSAALELDEKQLLTKVKAIEEDFDKILSDAKNRTEPGVIHKSTDELKNLIAKYGQKLQMVHTNDIFYKDLITEKYPKIHVFYSNEQDLFNKFGLELKIDKLRNKKVTLSGGGNIIIEETEALVSIDVNTGSNTKGMNNILEVNIAAAREIGRQIKLRNLAGIIICDFVSMNDDDEFKKIKEVLELELKDDIVKSTVYDPTELGLIQIARRRVGKSLSSVIFRTGYSDRLPLFDYYLLKLVEQRIDKLLENGALNLNLNIIFNPIYREPVEKFIHKILIEKYEQIRLGVEFSYRVDTVEVKQTIGNIG
ncbi:MAG: ribonuclease E/G [Clostridiaceae bacterium]